MTLLDVVVCVCMLALSVVAVYGLIRFVSLIGDVKRDSEYLNAAVDAMDMQTKSLNTQMHHANVRIQVLVEKYKELECHQNELRCHHDQLKKNMLVMHQNNQMLHDQIVELKTAIDK